MEMRSCNSCYYVDGWFCKGKKEFGSSFCNILYSEWKPIEERNDMETEKIQMTEEWWNQVYDDCLGVYDDTIMEEVKTTRKNFIASLKENDYIKKSAVEEADEMYRSWTNWMAQSKRDTINQTDFNLIMILWEAIQELKGNKK